MTDQTMPLTPNENDDAVQTDTAAIDDRFSTALAATDEPTPPTSATISGPVEPVTGDAEAFAHLITSSTEAPEGPTTTPVDGEGTPNPSAGRKAPAKLEKAPKSKKQKATPAAPTGPVAGIAPKAAATTIKLVPTASSFDLLEGGYQKVRQTRVLLEVVVGVAAALLIVVAGIGVRASLSTSNYNTLLQSIKSETTNKINYFNQQAIYRVGTTTYTLAQLDGDIAARLPTLKTITGSQLDILRILADINALSTTGARITSVSITPTLAVTSTTPGTPSTPAGFALSVMATTTSPGASSALLSKVGSLGYLVKAGQPGGLSYVLGGTAESPSVTITSAININPSAGQTPILPLPASAAAIKVGGN